MKQTHHPLRIVFMGTPQFAVASLDILHKNNFDIAAVITAPDKAANRGMKLQTTAVKDFALAHQLKVLQPSNLKDELFLQELKALEADLFVIVAFRMLPEKVWNMPPMGSVNLHASLLPHYRGAAPINWAIINGEQETGVTTFFLQHEIDTGQIIFAEKTKIEEEETAGTLHDKLMLLGADVLLKTVQAIEAKSFPSIAQAAPLADKIAPKIFKETCAIDWSKDIASINNHIRGLSPYPAATTILQEKKFKIFKVTKHFEQHPFESGHVDCDNKNHLHVYAKDGYLSIKELQLEGKKRMEITEFLRGYKMI